MEGGAMVLADGGVVCIDEFDKVGLLPSSSDFLNLNVFMQSNEMLMKVFLFKRWERMTASPSMRPWSSRPSLLQRCQTFITALYSPIDIHYFFSLRSLQTDRLINSLCFHPKAGITTTLNSRCSVLAAANSVFGRWDDTKGEDNIDFMPTILSRFDMIFIIKDHHDQQRDMVLLKDY